MTGYNANNERIKRHYFAYLKEAKRLGEQSVDAAAEALDRFEVYTQRRDFKLFHVAQAIGFKNRLADQISPNTGRNYSKATVHVTLGALKAFFQWLAGQPGYKARLRYSDADYFHSSASDTRVAKARRDPVGPTLEQVKHVIATMPSATEIQRRNRTLIAFTLLTGARDSAIASLKLKHIDLTTDCVHQDAREVRTKFSKTFPTYFFPVGAEIRQIVSDWVTHLRQVKLWGNDDPLFPATRVAQGKARQFEAAELERRHWSSAAAIREIFRVAFANAGLPYFNPHSLRHTLVRLGEERCRSPEAFKAWSQNLGHEKVMTTFTSYGAVSARRQAEIIRDLAKPAPDRPSDVDELAEALARRLRQPSATNNAPPDNAP
jgi:integrase